MLKNYFRIAWRNLMKRKAFSAINISGLAIGMAICLLIVVYISGEMGYDRTFRDNEHIYRVVVARKYPERTSTYSNIPQSYAAAMQQEFPEVEEVVRIFNFFAGSGLPLRYNNEVFEGKDCKLVDSNFFKVFNHPFIAGNPATALMKHQSLVITESTARTFFGDPLKALGKQMEVAEGNRDLLEITGVIADWPARSHFQVDMLRTSAGLDFINEINYVNFSPHTYLKLNPHASPAAIEARFPSLIQKYAVTNIEQGFGISFAEFQKGGNGYRYYLQALTDIYLDSHLEGELRPNGSRQAIYIFSLIAIVIFVIACINFVNLATARSAERAKEVGLRKTFGSGKSYLIRQFLAESVTISLIGAFLAAGMAATMLGLFGQITNRVYTFSDLFQPHLMGLLLAFALITGVIAGLYPAFVLSSFNPIEVLKGRFPSGARGMGIRNGLVVFQFAISVVLIIGTVVVNQQMQYMTGSKLGFKKEQVLMIERSDLLGEQSEAWRNELMSIPGIKQVSFSSAFPGTNQFFGISWQQPASREPMTGRGMICDDAFAETLGLQLLKGRFFSKAFATDSLAVVINERAARELGLQNPVGSEIITQENFLNAADGKTIRYKVIGLVKDFHYQSLYEPVNPLVINNLSKFGGGVGNWCAIKLSGENIPSKVAAIEEVWKGLVPEKTMQLQFLDQAIEQQYHSEITTRRLFTLFASLAIFIACIGLFGLAAYATQLRMREIGIRKVLGASVTGIAKMVSVDFLKLVGLASLLAFPVAWMVMHNWLQDFAYRVSVQPWVFIMAALLAFAIALLTISFQTLKAAFRNPVETLRTE